VREEGRRRAHPGLIVLMDAARGPPWSSRPAEPCSRNAAGSCADSVAANNGKGDEVRVAAQAFLDGAYV
jgi:hypothetical protein